MTTFGFISALKSLDLPLGGPGRLRERRPAAPLADHRPVPPRDEPRPRPPSPSSPPRTGSSSPGPLGARPELRRLLALVADDAPAVADGASLRRTTLHAAWAFGIPAITTPPPCDEPAIVDGENCLLVREPTPACWADAIARVLDDPALEARLSEGGPRRPRPSAGPSWPAATSPSTTDCSKGRPGNRWASAGAAWVQRRIASDRANLGRRPAKNTQLRPE